MKILLILFFWVLMGSLTLSQVNGQQRPTEWSADWLQINWEMEKIQKGIVTDTLVIHHTGAKPGMTWQDLSKEQRDRLYVPRYNISNNDPLVKGQEPHSGHFRYSAGKLVEVFYAYHWIIRQDGTAERLLSDEQVGWHAGNWDENMRSIGIVLDGDYANTAPPEIMLKALAKLIAQYAANKSLAISKLKAHYDFKDTDCPGQWYRQKGKAGVTGRQRLLQLAKVTLAE